MGVCSVPRCDTRAVGMLSGRWWSMCLDHAVAYQSEVVGRETGHLEALLVRDQAEPMAGQQRRLVPQ